jgi:hypothetical protein
MAITVASKRFDELTRLFSQGTSRRVMLRRVLAGTGAAVGTAGLSSTTAAPNACVQACASQPHGRRQAACKQACRQCDANMDAVCLGDTIACCAGGVCCTSENGTESCSSDLVCEAPRIPVGCSCLYPEQACPDGFPQDPVTCTCLDCVQGRDPVSKMPWVQCGEPGAISTVISSIGPVGEPYFADLICQEVGYGGRVKQFGTTGGSTCGYFSDTATCTAPGPVFFDSAGYCDEASDSIMLCGTVWWECMAG